tara:strand:- start:214 stop:678 length:465 start_codon:yes stop_codon:yes gene_type:complete
MATLTITLTESLTLGDGSGTDRGSSNVQTLTVNEVDHRIMDVPTSWVDIIKFDAANSAGTFKDASVKYLRITNLDSSNFISLRIRDNSKEYFVKVEAEGDAAGGCNSFILGPTVMDAESTTGFGTDVSFVNIDQIQAKADTAAVQVEYFVASQD